MEALTITSFEVIVARVPIEAPVRTAFGEMHDRPAVFLCLTDQDGHAGWGEIWANWPSVGAEHRARLALADLAPLVLSRAWPGPDALHAALTASVEMKAIQTAEPGPYAQVIAGIDTAAWDLAARRAGVPLAALLEPEPEGSVRVYASGIHIDEAARMIPAAREAGHRAFKIKVGLDPAADAEKLYALAGGLAKGERLMVDANMGFTAEEARWFADAVADLGLVWFEEPIRADAPRRLWRDLANACAMPLAGGENIPSRKGFEAALELGALGVIQPDVAKWGGVTGCAEVARQTLAAGRVYCPHFLGGGIGLAASAHLLAAVGGQGYLEIDVNPNPLRDAVSPAWPAVRRGRVTLPGDGADGLGVTLDLDAVEPFVTFRQSAVI